jgi:glycosyltransferase involved in cell wall biosynthesis
MKLGLIVPGGFDRGDRIIPALHHLTQQLASRHEVVVFAEDGESGQGHYQRAGADVHQLGGTPDLSVAARGWKRRGVDLARFGWRLARAVELTRASGPFHLLHAFWAGNTGLAATLLGRRLSVPVVVSVGGGEAVWLPRIRYGGAGNALGRARLRLTLGMASAVTAGSLFAAQRLPDAGVRREARVIPLGIEPEAFPVERRRTPGPPWRLLQVADLNRVKDQETTLRAVQRLAARVSDVSIDFVGEDTSGGRLARLAETLGLASRARFHGFVPQRELASFFERAHLHVMSSIYESQGVSILEAGAACLPTVGTTVGILPTLAPEAAIGVPPGDPAALADAIYELLLDNPRRQAMGEAALRWVTTHDAAWTAREFEDVYASVLPSRRGEAA